MTATAALILLAVLSLILLLAAYWLIENEHDGLGLFFLAPGLLGLLGVMARLLIAAMGPL